MGGQERARQVFLKAAMGKGQHLRGALDQESGAVLDGLQHLFHPAEVLLGMQTGKGLLEQEFVDIGRGALAGAADLELSLKRQMPQDPLQVHLFSARFGQEAFAILEWMQSQPGLKALFDTNTRRIQAGAHRINARYLLDGGLAAPALQAYGRSLRHHPPTAFRESHRILYAALALMGLGRLKDIYYRLRRGKVNL